MTEAGSLANGIATAGRVSASSGVFMGFKEER